ncbi:MAG TPA: ABC transporter ATP-binding protein, partial [Bradyrhizobium sp.]|nr:ABC transporter ATP-binding protein [Bradyrhizobium sp.]
MAPKPPSISPPPDSPGSASAEAAAAAEIEKRLREATPVPEGKAAAPTPSDDDDLETEDDEDEDLVVFTAKEAAGALATVYAFVRPFLKNYKKMLAFVGIGVVVETLFNVIMPLSLKFLIDDALGEEDFQALYMILGVLAAAGIFTSIVAVWYERWDARFAACVIADVRARLFEHVQDLP